MLFHVLHISNIFPGTQPKEGTDEDLQNAPMLPASMIVAKNKNNLCDCCKINKAGSPHIASMHAQYTNSKLTYSCRSTQPPSMKINGPPNPQPENLQCYVADFPKPDGNKKGRYNTKHNVCSICKYETGPDCFHRM